MPQRPGYVTIAGSVLDASTASALRDVEVVALGPRGELSTTSAGDGSFRLAVPAGAYRMFVRDARYMSIALRQNPRIHGGPRAVTAGVPDTALLARVDATADIAALELLVARAVTVIGRVVDPADEPVAGAVVRAQCPRRPVLGTDVATSDRDGVYTLRLPAGERCFLDASHPDFAGLREPGDLAVGWDDPLERDLALTPGCIVTGTVIDPRGEPAGDGAIELHESSLNDGFGPAGTIAPDGTFRWTTTESAVVTIRAWPWRSPPSPARTFTCFADRRFDDVVFQLPVMPADLDGVLVDRAGHPLPFTFVDLAPLAPDGIGQQERTDAEGRWRFSNVPAGPYMLHAHVAGHGIVTRSIMAPQADGEQLALGGTARLAGTTSSLLDGSFELVDLRCTELPERRFQLDEPPRLIPVRAGAFAVEDLPACKLAGRARWRKQEVAFEADLTAGRTATVELELGTPRPKRVHGVVRGEDGEPVAHALVGARTKGQPDELTTTDERGRYTITAAPGAYIHASASTRSAEQQVGAANVDEERIDLVLRAP